MEFRPIQTRKVYQEIVEQIKVMISDGKLRPGDKLMSERELADKMQVGRSAVREAFRTLEVMKIIEVRPGEGTFIREASSDYIIEALSLVINSEHESTKELMELRKMLEEDCAALAAINRSESDLATMKKELDQMEKAVNAGKLGYDADLAFHYSIYKATGNAIIFKLMATLRDTVRNALREVLDELRRTETSTPTQLYQEHLLIYEAIKNKDPESARIFMRKHLNTALKGVFTDSF